MTIVGFNFTKIVAEKKKPVKGKVSVENNVAIKNVEEAKLAFDPKKAALRFEFLYVSKYEPEIGNIELAGEIIFLIDQKEAAKVMKSWKKDKKVPPNILQPIMNNILNKSNVQAIVVSKDLNLPAPIPMPKMK